MSIKNTRGATRSIEERLEESRQNTLRLQQEMMAEEVADHPEVMALQEEIAECEKEGLTIARFIKVGLENKSKALAKAEQWQNRYDDAIADRPLHNSILAELKAKRTRLVEKLVSELPQNQQIDA